MPTKLVNATEYLISQVDSGIEYDRAVEATSWRFALDEQSMDQVESAFDSACSLAFDADLVAFSKVA